MSTKNILIIGGGFGQLPAILASKSMGLFVHVVDGNINAPGMKLADIAHAIDILNVNDVVAIARQYRIDGTLTLQSDIGVPTVGAIVDALGLPGNGLQTANRCSDKIQTRLLFTECNIPQPKFAIVKTVAEVAKAALEIGYPCVIKAPDSSGSRGVTKISNLNQIEAAFNIALQYTRGTEILVEEFISGIEIGAQAFSIDGNCVLALVHDDDVSLPPYMIPIGHAYPSSLSPTNLAAATEQVKQAVNVLGIRTGPSNVDLIIDNDGQSKIIEIGARIGATCLPELVYQHTGIDWVKQAILASLGETLNLTVNKKQPCAAYIIEADQDGIFFGFDLPAEMRNNPDILEWEITPAVGDTVSRFRKGTDRIGKVVTQGASQQEATDLAKRFQASLKFDIRP